MKNSQFSFCFALLFSAFSNLSGQTNSIKFSYNANGSLIERKLQVIQNPGSRFSHPNSLFDSIPEGSTDIKVYPNPSNTVIHVEGSLPLHVKEAHLTLITMNGQKLRTEVYTGTTKTLSVADLKSGMYLLEIIFPKMGKSTYKIIVSN